MIRTIIYALIGAILFAVIGYFGARLNIWWYHLGQPQATLSLYGAPIVMAIFGVYYGVLVSIRER